METGSQNGGEANGMAWFTCGKKKSTKVIKSKTSLVTWNPQESLSWHKTIQKKKWKLSTILTIILKGDYSCIHGQQTLIK